MVTPEQCQSSQIIFFIEDTRHDHFRTLNCYTPTDTFTLSFLLVRVTNGSDCESLLQLSDIEGRGPRIKSE
jgi:hypothetical protein